MHRKEREDKQTEQQKDPKTGVLLLYAMLAFVVFGALALMGSDVLWFIAPVPLLIGIVFLALAITNNKIRVVPANVPSSEVNLPAPLPFSNKRQMVVVKATRRAGTRSQEAKNLLDIGLLVYDEKAEPRIFRTSHVPSNTSYIRPFIVINLSTQAEDMIIRFELIDAAGELSFQSESGYHMQRGRNLLVTKTWLPITDQEVGGKWTLQVSRGNDMPFAIHEFSWLAMGGDVRAEFNGDGEIDADMRTMIDQAVDEPMSLHDLLAEQRDIVNLVEKR